MACGARKEGLHQSGSWFTADSILGAGEFVSHDYYKVSTTIEQYFIVSDDLVVSPNESAALLAR